MAFDHASIEQQGDHSHVTNIDRPSGDVVFGNKYGGSDSGGGSNSGCGGGSGSSTTVWRRRIVPLHIAGRPVRSLYLVGAGLLGLLANVITVWQGFTDASFDPTTPLPMPVPVHFSLLLGGAVLLFGGALLRARPFANLSFFLIERDRSDRLYLTQIDGECGQCGSSVRIRNVGPQGQRLSVAMCRRDVEHRALFDPAVLPNIEDELDKD